MAIIRTAGSGALKRLGTGGENHERAMPMTPNAISTLATGVSNPTKTKTPLAAMISPTPQVSKAGVR